MSVNRPSFYSGLALIALGIVFLVTYLLPGSWPVILIALGIFFLIIAAVRKEGWPVITGLVNTTLGGILLYQTLSEDWSSWYFLWPLIFAAVGAGLLITRLVDQGTRQVDYGSRYMRVSWGWLALGVIASIVLGLFRAQIGWPSILWGMGILFLLEAMISGIGPFAIPGMIFGGLGLILALQNQTGAWESWAYAWALIPGLVGLGLLLAFIRSRTMRVIGLSMLTWSLVVFVLFGTLFAGQGALSYLWPLALIVAGMAVLVQGLLARRNSGHLQQ